MQWSHKQGSKGHNLNANDYRLNNYRTYSKFLQMENYFAQPFCLERAVYHTKCLDKYKSSSNESQKNSYPFIAKLVEVC